MHDAYIHLFVNLDVSCTIYQHVNNAIVFLKKIFICSLLCRPPSHLGQPILQKWRFMAFSNAAKSHPVPATEATLVLFAIHLAVTNISYATIKVYLSGVRHILVSAGLHDHFNLQLTPHLQQVLRGIKNGKL